MAKTMPSKPGRYYIVNLVVKTTDAFENTSPAFLKPNEKPVEQVLKNILSDFSEDFNVVFLCAQEQS